MRRVILLLLAAILVGGVGAVESLLPVAAQDKPPVVVEDDVLPLPETGDTGELPEELRDPAFDRYVDLRKLSEAVDKSDASAITDVALQLAEAERVLQRPHNAIAAKTVFTLAVRIAAEKRDPASLRRLGEHARRNGNDALAQQVMQAQTLAGAKRALDPVFQASADSLTAEQFAFMNHVAQELERARVLGDGGELLGLIESIKDLGPDVLPPGRKEALLKRLNDAAKEGKPDDSTADVLDLLGMPSRNIEQRLNLRYYQPYALVSLGTNKAVQLNRDDFNNQAPAVQFTWQKTKKDTHQKWTLEPSEFTNYERIRSYYTWHYLTAVYTGNGWRLEARPKVHRGLNQIFQLKQIEGSAIVITPKLNSGLAFDVPGGDSRDGLPIQLFSLHSGRNQRWFFSNRVEPRRITDASVVLRDEKGRECGASAVSGNIDINFTHNARQRQGFKNDEARSIWLTNLRAGTSITLFDSSTGARNDDYLHIQVLRNNVSTIINNLEKDLSDSDVRVRFYRRNGLAGKVSRMEIRAPVYEDL